MNWYALLFLLPIPMAVCLHLPRLDILMVAFMSSLLTIGTLAASL